MHSVVHRGAPAWSYYGGEPDEVETFCPSCHAANDFALIKVFRGTRKRRISTPHPVHMPKEAA